MHSPKISLTYTLKHVASSISTWPFVVLVVFSLGNSACSSSKKNADATPQATADSNLSYEQRIEKNTRSSKKYDGFYNKFDVSATFINSDVQTFILEKKADVYKWDTATLQKEREKMFQESSTETHFAVSLYTPAPRLNDLHKGTSIWKIYLEANGTRYPGRAKRRNGTREEIQAMFPYHTRWNVPYEITFPVPLATVEGSKIKFILTSTEGTAELEF